MHHINKSLSPKGNLATRPNKATTQYTNANKLKSTMLFKIGS